MTIIDLFGALVLTSGGLGCVMVIALMLARDGRVRAVPSHVRVRQLRAALRAAPQGRVLVAPSQYRILSAEKILHVAGLEGFVLVDDAETTVSRGTVPVLVLERSGPEADS